MRWTIVGLAIALLGCVGCLHAPMPWSPDGSWLAYTVEVRPLDQIMAPGWMFEAGKPPAQPAPVPASGYQLWATRASNQTSVLLEESTGPLTAPGWSPDGRALAFGRVVTEADRGSRFDVVVLEGLTRRRVVSSRPLAALDAEASRLPYQAIVWSPDGRYLAIPQLEPVGLAIVRVDNGRTVNMIPDAFLPSWSPTGGRLAFYLRSGGGYSLHYVESALGQPRHLMDVGQVSQAPGWSRDASSVLVVARRPNGRLGEGGTEACDLVRVRLDTSAAETIRSLSADVGMNRERQIEGTSVAFDRDAENLFCSTTVAGQLNQVVWYHPRDNAVFKKFAIIDHSVPVGSLSFSPDGRTLAARSGLSDRLTAPVFCDTENAELKSTLIAPDDAARLEWVATLTYAARTILAELPGATARVTNGAPTPVGRPTILPLLNELTALPDQSLSFRLRKIGKLGRPLCDRPSGASEPGQVARQVFDEARLFFDYLREDYSEAMISLKALEAGAGTPERRLALLTIRAQILLNQGQMLSARRIIAFLDQVDRPIARRAEWAGQGYVLTDEPRPDRGWPRYLAEASIKVEVELTESKRPGSDLDLIPSRSSALFKAQAPFRPNPAIFPGGDPPFIPRKLNPPRFPTPPSVPRIPGQQR